MCIKFIGKINNDDVLGQTSGIIICGAGSMLDKLVYHLKERKLYNRVRAIADNDPAKWGTEINGVVVQSYNELVEKYSDLDYIVYNYYSKDIFYQLVKEKINNIHLIRNL
ncbi:hypothetical protein [Anaerovibrio lipolyticus]|uniref:hypothetical protein n=1 Tax=Anaerovibrio lipolyticus TaxID=82374 RepID=UPI000485AFBD|nr:hypothetical protein [Anaerovibrio lipolyticus]